MEGTSDLIKLAGLALAFVLLTIRVCGDQERIALTTSDRFRKIVGPGMFLKLPPLTSTYEYTRLRIGDRGVYLAPGWAVVNDATVPVELLENAERDDPIEIQEFSGKDIVVRRVS